MVLVKNSLNFVLKNGIIFLISIIWCNFYINNKILSFSLAIFLTLVLSILFDKIVGKTKAKKSIATLTAKERKQFKIFLQSSNEKEQKDILTKLTKQENITTNFIYKSNILCFNFLNSILTENQLFSCCKKAKEKNKNKLIIFCLDVPKNLVLLCSSISNFEIEIYNYEKIFELLKEKNYKFQQNIEFQKSYKLTAKAFFEIMFSKKNAKAFFVLGIITFLSSYLTFFKLYYYIWASILLILGLICLLKKQQATKQNFLN